MVFQRPVFRNSWRRRLEIINSCCTIHGTLFFLPQYLPPFILQLQNNLEYIALSNLAAATFQVTYQFKILTTALFSVTLLHRSLSVRKWVSLFMLTFGVAIIQLPSHFSLETHHHESFFSKHFSWTTRGLPEHARTVPHTTLYTAAKMNRTLGLTAVFGACLLSGLAGVYFEKVLKGSNKTIWVRNVQLSFFSLFPALLIGVLWKDGDQVLQKVRPHKYYSEANCAGIFLWI